ncbi:hypothetical protein E1A91_D13G245800v1 [Gossypium mustelinum]|uniref:Fe2OG dioxygenase domain-containing protein n=1 Tax=Gossypium mustelinum TaxID=34275 RepID=A0A5D2S663_GOSMU|nr:hypothetical protein E1A91_D13G245800v1 [Gossypium mustelinum]
MGVNAKIEVPVIEFCSSDLERGTDGWHHLCKRVREACETYGCFEVVYKRVSKKVREEMFGLVKELVQVPLERKQKNASPLPYHGWVGPCSQVSLLYEGFGLGDLLNLCGLMVTHAFGEYESGLFAHTEKPVSTVICEDQVSGLEIEVKDGQWIKLSNLSPSSFVFVVGDPLKAWSNGRLKAVNHRVMMSGDKDRYSIATFAIPGEGTIIKAPKELIDEQHPQLYKDFNFMDFFRFAFSDRAKNIESGQQLHAFASLSPPISD